MSKEHEKNNEKWESYLIVDAVESVDVTCPSQETLVKDQENCYPNRGDKLVPCFTREHDQVHKLNIKVMCKWDNLAEKGPIIGDIYPKMGD